MGGVVVRRQRGGGVGRQQGGEGTKKNWSKSKKRTRNSGETSRCMGLIQA